MFSLGTVLVAPLPSALFAGFGLSFAGLAMGVLPRKLSLHLAESQRFLGLGLPENLLIEGAVER
jgi:hypothetical protein